MLGLQTSLLSDSCSVLVFCLSQGDPVFKFKLCPSVFLTRIYYWPRWGLPNVVQHCIAYYLHFLYSVSSQTLLHLLHYSQSRCRNSQHVPIWGPGSMIKHQEMGVKSFWILPGGILYPYNGHYPSLNLTASLPLKIGYPPWKLGWIPIGKPAIFRGFSLFILGSCSILHLGGWEPPQQVDAMPQSAMLLRRFGFRVRRANFFFWGRNGGGREGAVGVGKFSFGLGSWGSGPIKKKMFGKVWNIWVLKVSWSQITCWMEIDFGPFFFRLWEKTTVISVVSRRIGYDLSFQLLFGGGFKRFWFSPRSLGK